MSLSTPIFQTAYDSGYCTLAAWAFSITSLPAAAVYGATESITRNTMHLVLNNYGQDASVIKSALSYAAACPVAALATQYFGFPLTTTAAKYLTVSLIVPSLVATTLVITGLAIITIGFMQPKRFS